MSTFSTVGSTLATTDKIPRIISMFKKGATNFQLVAGEWPTFLYDERVGWDPNNIRDGLFRGHVLIQVCEICSDVHHISTITQNIPSGCPASVQK